MGSRLEANSSSVRKRIENHNFENEEGEEYESSKFGGFTDYFRRKKIKLQNLDTERRSSSSKNPQIFRGVVAHVNGYTQPSLNDLHTLIVTHGGGFLQYLDGKTMVTHIIASNLTPKKKVEFRKYRIVKPAWIVDSVNAGKLLPWDGYRVLDEGAGQQVLGFDNGSIVSQMSSHAEGYRDQTDTSWYTKQVKSVANELDGHELEQALLNTSDTLNDDYETIEGDNDLSRRDFDDTNHIHPQSVSGNQSAHEDVVEREDLGLHGNSSEDKVTPNRISTTASTRGQMSAPIFEKHKDDTGDDVKKLVQGSSFGFKAQDTEQDDPIKVIKKPEMTAEEHNAAILADPRRWKSTAVNPEFLKQYYEESRLHHLSSWKADLKSKLQALAAEKTSSQKLRQKRRSGSRRYILHVDFDSFFAAVSLKKHPQYVDKPVVVAHGGGSGSEIASCNYPARKFGVKNGMWMKSAQALCPDLKVLPYDFKAYEEASRSFYEVIMDTDGIVQSVSVDEALVDVTNECTEFGEGGDGTYENSIWREQAKADEIAHNIRDKVKEITGCAVSVGIGGNILLAKVALRKAKPAGQYHVKPNEVLDFMNGLLVQDLPGVAHSIGGKLEEIGVKLVKDVRELSKEKLISTLGLKTGQKIWDYARGIDRVEVGEQVIRKSVSAEVNWGIRFVTQEQADEFVQSLCEELHKRLVNENVKGRQLTMKIMRRAADAPLDPPKHMGHGKCDTYNKSVVLGVATNESQILGREAISIMRGWGFSPGELRGIGVQVQKLEPLKGPAESPLFNSQKRLQFKASYSPKSPTRREASVEDFESPQKPHTATPHLAASLSMDISPSGKRRQPLNTLGTQFVLPTQADPDVLAELPDDIRSKIAPKKPPKIPFQLSDEKSLEKSRSNSPALPPDVLPAQSQLDQETLNALPGDVRAEIMAFYHTSSKNPQAQGLLPQSPRKVRSINAKAKKIVTPTKKWTGLLGRGRPPGSKNAPKSKSTSNLTQSNFVANRSSGPNTDAGSESLAPDISPEFLSALPEDIRREILDQARRDRLKQKGGIDIIAKKASKPNRPAQPPPGQRRLDLPTRPPRPTFTAQKLSGLADLREAVRGWFDEFKDEGPYRDDVDALVRYLQKVVGDEGNMDKAVSVSRWLKWVMDDAAPVEGMDEWKVALQRIEDGVQTAVTDRGLGRVAM